MVLMSRGKIEDIMVTAIINILNTDNHPIRCRTLLDTAATTNLISQNLAKKLRLKQEQHSIAIGGLGDIQTLTSHMLTATIQSRYNDYEKKLTFFTVREIIKKHPEHIIERNTINIPQDIALADPTFHLPAEVDLLIGAGATLSTLLLGHKRLSSPQMPDLYLQNTVFGWIIGGSASIAQTNQKSRVNQTKACHITTSQALNQLCKIWDIEEGPKMKYWSNEEKICEEIYKNTHRRNSNGQYIVQLPFNEKKSLLGESRLRALKRLKQLENKFKINPNLHKQYAAVIQEYLDLGHMEIAKDDSSGPRGFYLPHHAVFKESSQTTKLRVVFDGSAKTSSGISLNETLMVGPNIQHDLITQLLKFRLHVFVLSGDIEKMYRQFLIHPNDRKFQKLLWRDETGSLIEYQLKTVTFGLAPAPFLAIRSLHQLANDEAHEYPIGAQIIKNDMYVDDLLTGANTLKDALRIRDEVINILKRGSLNIRQWAANDPRLLKDLPNDLINTKLQIESNSLLKTLGIFWQSQTDTINYALKSLPIIVTMRIMLTEIAKIFDPLGLVGPIIIAARLILQECWRQQINWDENLPKTIQDSWKEYASDFNSIQNVNYKRAVIPPESTHIQLHGFADASERAYGACIYIRSTNSTGEVHINLLCSKMKIAPLKAITLARLELCAALLLSNLYHTVKEHLTIEIKNAIFWSDSTIVLHWINTPTYHLKTFVANRVAEIQTKTRGHTWRHISTKDNPADALSRGQYPTMFIKNSLWTTGPGWLKYDESKWPISSIETPLQDDERRKFTCLTNCIKSSPIDDKFTTFFSSIHLLHRSIARCLRFSPYNHYEGNYSVEEISEAQRRIIKLIQTIHFTDDMHQLLHGQTLQQTSKLRLLNPFVDNHGIIRVGGRLRNTNISFEQQHPMILPQSHPYTTLIVKDIHEGHFHAGIQGTLYAIRQRFWPLNGKNEVKRVVHQCIRCIRAKPHMANYPMGDLPRERVTQSRPFYHTGVDYCGPFFIKEKIHRNRKKVKIYVAVFVCLAIKTVHLEVVSDLTTDGFIAALKRFMSRRGKCRSIHSDNATNFVGANNQLNEIYQQLNAEDQQQKINNYLIDKGINWKFIPARSPNFGGLWEAAVKSYKHHMTRIIGETLLSFEEFNTFVIEIEAIMNSRPMTALSSDPNDPIAITPGHFLIGDSITSIPDWDWTDTASKKLSSWQHIQKLKQSFWKRWHKDYLNGLNIRNKWYKETHGIKEGTTVHLPQPSRKQLPYNHDFIFVFYC